MFASIVLKLISSLSTFASVVLFATLSLSPAAQSSDDLIGLLIEGNPQAEELLKWAELSVKDQMFLDCYTDCLKADPNLVPSGTLSCQSTGRGTKNNCEDLKRISPKQRQRLACTKACDF